MSANHEQCRVIGNDFVMQSFTYVEIFTIIVSDCNGRLLRLQFYATTWSSVNRESGKELLSSLIDIVSSDGEGHSVPRGSRTERQRSIQ